MSDRASAPDTLWGRADHLTVAVTVGFGLALLVAGYWGVSGTRVFDDQVSAARTAAAGVLVAQLGFGLVVLRGRRALGRRLGVGLTRNEPAGAVTADGQAALRTTTGFVAAPDMTRYHRDSCAFVAGKAVVPAATAEHEQAGRRPCGVCLP